jgi:dihydrodipicolinate synthase/N-acetylneuraminate lyase
MMQAISGVNVAAITPHGKRGDEPDIGATLDLIDFLCAAGVQGVALLGSTGEFVNLNFDDRVRLVYLAVKRSRVPVLAGISHSTLDGALALGREAAAAGAAGLLLMPPFYYRYGQPEIREFYLRFVADLGHGPPIYLYNIPSFTSPISAGTATHLLSSGHFAGIKDSSGEWEYFEALRRLKQSSSFTLLVGHDAVFAAARRMGADGVVSGVACAVPELLLALDRAIQQRADAEAERLDARLHEFLSRIQNFPVPVAIKAALAVRGVKIGPLPVPLSRETLNELEEFRQWFRGWLADFATV